MNLNPAQQQAVDTDSPLVLVVASPGSGKTRVLVSRIQRLLGQGVRPERICAVTFTNQAAKEMAQRLKARCCNRDYDEDGNCDRHPNGVALGHCGTLHSLMFKLLARFGSLVGLPGNISVLDERKALEVLEDCAKHVGYKGSDKLLASTAADWREWNAPARNPGKVSLAVKEYNHRLKAGGALDFDRVLWFGEQLVTKLTVEQLGFDHVLVDEFQDSGDVDARIYKALAVPNKFFVGDTDQSIYGFRGGNVAHILDLALQTSVGGIGEKFFLETNYRSDRHICACAQRLIERNVNRVNKAINPRPDAQFGTVEFKAFPDAASELAWIANSITRQLEPGAMDVRLIRSFAVLFRTNALADAARDYLRGLGLPVAATPTVEVETPVRRVAKALLAFALNPYNDTLALDFIRIARGEEQAKVAACAAAGALQSVNSAVLKFTPLNGDQPCSIRELASCFDMSGITPPDPVVHEFIHEATTLAQPFTLGDLLLSLSRRREKEQDKQPGQVFVGTAHSAKGLEWDAVFVGGVEQEVWPGRGDCEEERRLLYVAATRARHWLGVSWVAARACPFATWKSEPRTVSGFVAEMGWTGGTP